MTHTVTFNFKIGSQWYAAASVLDVSVTPRMHGLPFGGVVDSVSRLQGRVKSLTPNQIWLYFLHREERADGDDRSSIGTLELDCRAGYETDWLTSIVITDTKMAGRKMSRHLRFRNALAHWFTSTVGRTYNAQALTFLELCCESGMHRRGCLLLVADNRNNRTFRRIGYIQTTDKFAYGIPYCTQQREAIAKWHED